jgi:hypothetical protein
MTIIQAATGVCIAIASLQALAADQCGQGRDLFYKSCCAGQSQMAVCKDLKEFLAIAKFTASHSFCDLKATKQRVSNVRDLGLQNQRQAPPSLRKSPEVVDLPNQMLRDMAGGFLFRSVSDHKNFSVAAADQDAYKKLSEKIKKDYGGL